MRCCAGRPLCCSLALSLAWPVPARAEAPVAPSASTSAASARVRPAAPVRALPSDAAALARDAFSEGLRLVNAGDYAAAQSAFARAYTLEPHPLSLYNIGQCQVRLGQYAAAVQTLERFLAQAGDTIDPEQRRAVTRRVSELRVVAAEDPSAEPAPAASPRAVRAPSAEPVKTEAVQTASVPAVGRGSLPWGWLLGGTGLALLGSATTLYFWNDGRYAAWRTDRVQLAGVPNRELLVQQSAALWDTTHASNERLASIQRVDVLSAVVAGVGAAALGLGIWQLLAAEEGSTDLRSQASASPFRWRMNW
jgi:tetratricopeptide (TPR) repeat protein